MVDYPSQCWYCDAVAVYRCSRTVVLPGGEMERSTPECPDCCSVMNSLTLVCDAQQRRIEQRKDQP